MDDSTFNPNSSRVDLEQQKKREEKRRWYERVRDLIKELALKYQADPSDLIGVEIDLWTIGESFGGENELKGKRILDIGCGSTTPELNDRSFEPWLCRALHELGAHPVGVDIGEIDTEKFEHYQLDLSKPGALNLFPDKSFDGVNCRAFLDSPRFMRSGDLSTIRLEI